jgi:hypothetical protein
MRNRQQRMMRAIPAGATAGNGASLVGVFDNGIRKGDFALRQLIVTGLFFSSVEAATRQAVEYAFSTLKHPATTA